MTSPPIGTDQELIERLRRMAKSSSEAQRMIAEAKTARQTDREDSWTDAGYSWPAPEQTYEWKAADALQSRISEVERLSNLASKLVAKLDECAPHVANLTALQYVRSGTQYTGPSYGEALEELRAALSQHRTRDE